MPLVMAGLILGIWGFPRVWYTRMESSQVSQWWAPVTGSDGWDFHSGQVDAQAERLLVADQLTAAEFNPKGHPEEPVRVLSARRNREDPREIGLFVHTPDRCWVQAGWTLVPTHPDLVQVDLQGRSIGFERRLFRIGDRFELVYFTGLVAGQTLPYRLDHNLSVSLRVLAEGAEDRTHGANRWNDSLLWRRVWDSFLSRRPLLGPKQFLRVSTPVVPGRESDGDERLRRFLREGLRAESVVSEGVL